MPARLLGIRDADDLRLAFRIGVLARVDGAERGPTRTRAGGDAKRGVQAADRFRVGEHPPRALDRRRHQYLGVDPRLLPRNARPLCGQGLLPDRCQRAEATLDSADMLVLLDVRRVLGALFVIELLEQRRRQQQVLAAWNMVLE